MNNLILKYEATKIKAQNFMKKGQIGDYFNALLELKKQRQLLKLIIAN